MVFTQSPVVTSKDKKLTNFLIDSTESPLWRLNVLTCYFSFFFSKSICCNFLGKETHLPFGCSSGPYEINSQLLFHFYSFVCRTTKVYRPFYTKNIKFIFSSFINGKKVENVSGMSKTRNLKCSQISLKLLSGAKASKLKYSEKFTVKNERIFSKQSD